MNPDGLIEKKQSGKDELNPKDMAAISGMDESYIRKAMKFGFLNLPHYSSTYAVNGVQLSGTDMERVETHQHVLKEKTKGQYPDKDLREAATGLVVEENKKSGRPVFFKFKEKSAEEVFTQFWKSPAGKQRMTGKLKNEIANIDRGGQWYDNPAGLHAMPEGYDEILWDTTKKQAAQFHALALAGDEDSAKKYRRLQERFPEQLPVLEAKIEPKMSVKEKILRD